MRISDWSSDVCSSDLALTLYRRAIEHEKPDAQREAGYQDRDDARIEGAMQQMERRYVPEMDRQLQRYWLQQYVALPEEQHDEALDKWLGGSDDKHVEQALDALAKTKLDGTGERLRWLEASREDFESSKDPAIQYAVAVMPSLLEREAERKARAGDALLARPVYLQAVADYRKDQGGAVYPDANGSLRITFGHVQPYTKLNGAKQLPFTTLEQIAATTTGRAPFASPHVLVAAIEAKRHGGLADKRLGTIPVHFPAALAITDGTSGPPVRGARGGRGVLTFNTH